MIKSSTIQKAKAKKELPKILSEENRRLNKESDKGCELVKESNEMISHLQDEIKIKEFQIEELKNHWTHKIYNWFK